MELNLDKTKVVYCKDSNRKEKYKQIQFDFLGFTFKPRKSKSKQGKIFTSYQPGISNKAQKAIREEVRRWRLQLKVDKDINSLAKLINPKIQDWINYYSHFYKEELREVLSYINKCIAKWAKSKFKRLNSRKKAIKWLKEVAKREPNMFAHWKFGVTRTAM